MIRGITHSDQKKVVLLTGASAGLGLALAKQLIREDQYILVFSSRSESLHKFAEHDIYTTRDIWLRNLDVIDYRQISSLIDEINEKLGGVDILINNAGIAESSCVEDSEDYYRQQQLDVNYLAPFEIISRVLERMREKKWGRIINISSAGGFMAMPTMSSYSASKFALEGATESLWYEMRPWGVSVTLIVPGFIHSLGYLKTKSTIKSASASTDKKSTYFRHYEAMAGLISKNMASSTSTNEVIAAKISAILRHRNPPLRVHVTFDAWLFYWLRKVCPPNFYHYLLYRLLPNIQYWGLHSPKSAKNLYTKEVT